MTIKQFFSNLFNVLMDGTWERVRVVNQMNQAFREYFASGDFDRLCKVSISQGDPLFQHEMSSIWLRSGFKITVENDSNLRDSEIAVLAQYVTGNESFVRQLMAMGFDTLVVKGKSSSAITTFELSKYANLKHYYID